MVRICKACTVIINDFNLWGLSTLVIVHLTLYILQRTQYILKSVDGNKLKLVYDQRRFYYFFFIYSPLICHLPLLPCTGFQQGIYVGIGIEKLFTSSLYIVGIAIVHTTVIRSMYQSDGSCVPFVYILLEELNFILKFYFLSSFNNASNQMDNKNK